MHHILYTRKAFEGRLKTMAGLEYMVAQEPAEMAPGTGTGVWVIRKQKRTKVPGRDDDIEVLATYFVVGLNVYMAPSVGDILSGRLVRTTYSLLALNSLLILMQLSITASLKKFVEITSSIAKFTPASGHTYFQPKAISKTAAATAQASNVATPLPTNQASANASAKNPSSPTDATDTSAEARLLSDSLLLSVRYGDVYMDENPITGQPGDFHFSSTGRVEKDKLLAMPLPTAKQPFASQLLGGKKGEGNENGQLALGLKTKDLPGQGSRKGSKAEKSPRTPGGGKVKRRKSKSATAVGTPQATSPV